MFCVRVMHNCTDKHRIKISQNEHSKAGPRTDHEGPQVELMYSATLSLTSVLDVGRWLTPRPGLFTPGKDRGIHCIGG